MLLVSSRNHVGVTISTKYLHQSEYLRTFTDKNSTTEIDYSVEIIVLIRTYLVRYAHLAENIYPLKKPLPPLPFKYIVGSQLDQYMTAAAEYLPELMSCADYLGIKPLFELCAAKLANQLTSGINLSTVFASLFYY